MNNSVTIAFIGFGEVGRTFSRGPLGQPDIAIAAYDLLFDDALAGGVARAVARDIGVTAAADAASAAAGAQIVFSAVTASDVLGSVLNRV